MVVTSMPDKILCVIAIIHVMWIDMRIHNHTPTVTFVGLTTEKASAEIVNHDEAQTMPLWAVWHTHVRHIHCLQNFVLHYCNIICCWFFYCAPALIIARHPVSNGQNSWNLWIINCKNYIIYIHKYFVAWIYWKTTYLLVKQLVNCESLVQSFKTLLVAWWYGASLGGPKPC